jgi:hypothetical protein
VFEPPFDYLVSIPYYSSFEPRISPSDRGLPNSYLSFFINLGQFVAQEILIHPPDQRHGSLVFDEGVGAL